MPAAGDAPTRARYLPNTLDVSSGKPTFDAAYQTLSHLEAVVQNYPPIPASFAVDELNGLFAGPTSIAYLFFLLSQPGSLNQEAIISGKHPAAWSAEYLSCAANMSAATEDQQSLDKMDPRATPNVSNCGIYNEHLAWHAVSAVLTQRSLHVDALLAILPEICDNVTEDNDLQNGEHEWLHGRAGYLYLLRIVRTYFSVSAGEEQRIPQIVTDRVIQRMLADGPSTPRRWLFHGRPYLGAAHGWIGIITQILLTEPTAEHYKRVLAPVLVRILDLQLPSGNWPAFIMDDPGQNYPLVDDLVQTGHGGPGVVISLLALRHRVYNATAPSSEDQLMQHRLDNAIEHAQNLIWEQGLLTKEPCLLHGATGNALALTKSKRAAAFLSMSTPEIVQEGLKNSTFEPSSSSGLLRGIASRAWAFWMWQRDTTRNERSWGSLPVYSDI